MEQTSLYDVIDHSQRLLKDDLFTALPAEVLEYNSKKQTVRVRSVIDVLYKEDQLVQWELDEVPVIFPSAGDGILSFPIKKGDNVLLIFSKHEIDTWKQGDGSAKVILRDYQHDINNAIAIVGLYANNKTLEPNPEDVELKFKDTRITLKADGRVEVFTNDTLKIQNSEGEEYISLLSDILELIETTTVNTVYGQSPLNNKVQIEALRKRLDTFKE